MSVLTARGPIFYSTGDETAFFTWLRKIRAVQRAAGRGRDIEIQLRAGSVSMDEMQELRAIFHRYGLDTSSLEDLPRT